MTRRIVVHAGFHKTGTTSAQAFLAENGPVLWPVMALGLGYKFRPLLSATRGYSTWRDLFSLEKVRRRLKRYLDGLHLGKRDLLISAEELSGHLPGRGALKDYSAAPILMREIEDVLLSTYPGCDLSFVFTLRKPETWWPSAYWEHVKSSRLTLGYDAFMDRYGALDLQASVDAIDLKSEIHTYWLEDIAHDEHGPATPLLSLMGLSRARWSKLNQVPRKNRAPEGRPGLITQFLDLNRSDLDQDALKAAKKALLDAAGAA